PGSTGHRECGARPRRFRRILDAQSSREERLAIADDVIVNDADLDTLTRKVADVHTFYVASSRHPSFAKDRASAQN
ncbi:MAG: hypothetical protein AAGJ36_11185, partial [Pseudomonadota bacterium]